MKKWTLFMVLPFFAFSQESAQGELNLVKPVKISYLDSLKNTFVNHSTSSCIDTWWMNELNNKDLFDGFYSDISDKNYEDAVNFDLSSDVLKKRLKKMDEKSPFSIEYNPYLENVIKSFLKNRKGGFERLMAISEYYFPLFEEHLAKHNIPLELKYLAIVESALNPKAKSRVGATGLWQFMYPTGKQFNLQVDSYIDERYDPLKATEAACQYLSSLHQMFGDWSLALAAYNCGPGNVSKAIRRSGGSQNYWNIRKFLPTETANYVPAFLATMYVYEFKKEHGLTPKRAKTTYFETDTIMVKREMSFKDLSQLLDIPESELEFFNPIYKLKTIPFLEDKPQFLRLPKDKLGIFVSNEEKIYAYLDYLSTLKEKTEIVEKTTAQDSTAIDSSSTEKEELDSSKLKFHTVKRGESLGSISEKYDVSISELKKWNQLKSSTIIPGKRLRLYSSKATSNIEEKKSKKSSLNYYVVKSGDSLYSIAQKYPGISANDLKKLNNISGDNIQPGMKLKVK